MLKVTPFNYDKIFYNEAIDYQESDWARKLDEHERNVLIQGYKIGRTVEMLNQWMKEGNNGGNEYEKIGQYPGQTSSATNGEGS
jgi:hypothetical protein